LSLLSFSFFFDFVATNKAMAIVATITFFFVLEKKKTTTHCIIIVFFFRFVTTKKATTFVVVAFFFVFEKKKTKIMSRHPLLWFCCNVKGNNTKLPLPSFMVVLQKRRK